MRLYDTSTPIRVLLVKCSDVRSHDERDWPKAPPLGIMYISAVLKRDCSIPVDTRLINVEFNIANDDQFASLLNEYKPHIVGLSAVTAEFPTAKKLSETVKSFDERIVVLLGGPHATVFPESLNDAPSIDIAVVGEAEETVVELVECLHAGGECLSIDGIAIRDDQGAVQKTAARAPIMDLDSLPFPDWDGIDLSLYHESDNYVGFTPEGYRYMSLATSRGCPYQCIFCHNIFGKRTRFRSPENVLAEMRMLMEKHDVNEFMIVDDIFNLDADRMMRILDLMIDTYTMDTRLTFPNGVRGDLFTREQLDRLYQAGTYFMAFAIEVGSTRMQELINKRLDVTKTLENIKYASDLGIITCTFFMIGFPTETKEEILETLRLAAMPQIDLPNIFVTIPQYGTKLHELAQQEGKVPDTLDFDAYQYALSAMNCSAVPDEEFAGLRKMAAEIVSDHAKSEQIRTKMQKWNLTVSAPDNHDAANQSLYLSPEGYTGIKDDPALVLAAPVLHKLAVTLQSLADKQTALHSYQVVRVIPSEDKLELVLHSSSRDIDIRILPRNDDIVSYETFNRVQMAVGGGGALGNAERAVLQLVGSIIKRYDPA